jgi:hypothetical protein
MYEMYPEIWASGLQRAVAEPPRRRPRKAHSVLPAVIARQLAAAAERRPVAA